MLTVYSLLVKPMFLWQYHKSVNIEEQFGQSVTILVRNKSHSRFVVVRFCNHLYDYTPNWTPLSPVTTTYYNFLC